MVVWLCIAFMLFITYGIQAIENKSAQSQNEKFEKLQRDMYEWIDENISNETLARERKAEVDMTLHNRAESLGREYTPSNIKEVTTKKERKERNECALEGKRYVNEDLIRAALSMREPTEEEIWYYTGKNKSDEEKREHYIKFIMQSTGRSREDAEILADKNIKHMNGKE